ncbi:hypothetical protein DY000_02021879 [Brassica cretica]|uniref:Uncharacterized protein n=1 Tax=Brassica cretica TaxID=69181 RepID=A0ABQ7EDL0_BRACR|nr:hypothetical protein DY000_02021879 [Brassica cretica]
MNSRSSKSESKINQVFVGQKKMAVHFDWKISSIYSELTKKFKSLSDHVNMLDNQVAQTVDSFKKEEGFLPRKTNTNPRRTACVVTLRSGKQLAPNLGKGITIDEFIELKNDGDA